MKARHVVAAVASRRRAIVVASIVVWPVLLAGSDPGISPLTMSLQSVFVGMAMPRGIA